MRFHSIVEGLWRLLLNASNFEIIAEIIGVCGVGKHRSEKGESSIKALGQKMLMEMKSPLRIDKRKMDALLVKVKLLKSGYVNWGSHDFASIYDDSDKLDCICLCCQ